MVLQVLAELKRLLNEDADLELNVSKTSVLPKETTQETVFDVEYNIINVSPVLIHLSGDFSLSSFCPEGFVGIMIGVSIDTDVFVQNFVIDDVEKLEDIQSQR